MRTKMERYGDPHYNNMEKNKQTKLKLYGDENYNNQQKHEETCLERYSVKHHNQTPEAREHIRDMKLSQETQNKYEHTLLERYGTTNVNLVPEIMEKRLSTLRCKYNADNPLQNPDIKAKQLQTLKDNNSYAKSKIEEEVYNKLVALYGENDIERQYSDERYPFNCDFYIKSKDIFIEVNNHPSHGGHPFDNDSEEDRRLLEQLEKKDDDWSHMIIDVWANRDVKKFQYAHKNKLDYRVIYKNIDEIVYE